MAIFGRSKKKPTTPLRPHPEPEPIYNQQPSQPRPDTAASQPNWAYLEPRPQISPGNGSPPQSQGWAVAPVPSQNQPGLVHNGQIPQPWQSPQKYGNISRLNLASVSNLLATNVPDCPIIQKSITPLIQGAQCLNQGAALCDLISSKFDDIITLIDGEMFSGDERELGVTPSPQPMWQQQQDATGYTDRALGKRKSKGTEECAVTSAITPTNYFAKAYFYANSRLPPNLPPLKLWVCSYVPRFRSDIRQISSYVSFIMPSCSVL